MENNLEGKVALVTGATRGLGRELSNYLSRLGVKIVGIGRDTGKLKELEEEIKNNGGDILCYQLDICDFDGIKETVNQVIEKWNTIDILINNAGVDNRDPFEKLKKQDIDSILDINLKGTIYMSRHVIPIMMKQRKGHIINISSVAGLRGYQNGMYSATKFGMNGFGDAMSKYLINHNIHVVTLCPGGINTSWWEKHKFPRGNTDILIKPQEISRLVEFILKGDPNTLFKNVVLAPVCDVEIL